MYKTRHFETRCRQRRIAGFEVDLAILFGAPRGEKNCLGERSCRNLIEAAETWIKRLEEGARRDGLDLSEPSGR